MKKNILLSAAFLMFLSLSSFQKISTEPGRIFSFGKEKPTEVSDAVGAVLDKSCLSCHGVNGSSKAKFKWNFTKMDKMKSSKLLSKLKKVVHEIEEESMPPKKYLKKHPEATMTNDEAKLLIQWAEDLAKKYEP